MENQVTEKKPKSAPKTSSHSAVRVKKETRKKILSDIQKLNKKDWGRRVKVDEYIATALSLLKPEHLTALQEASLSNADRLDREYRAYVTKHGAISKDDYLGKRLAGELPSSAQISSTS